MFNEFKQLCKMLLVEVFCAILGVMILMSHKTRRFAGFKEIN